VTHRCCDCDRDIDACAFCDGDDCGHAVCHLCLLVALGEARPVLPRDDE
jgi:hypothetical protein